MGFPVGQATLIDEVGIDVGAHISNFMHSAMGNRFAMDETSVNFFKDLITRGYLGKRVLYGNYGIHETDLGIEVVSFQQQLCIFIYVHVC